MAQGAHSQRIAVQRAIRVMACGLIALLIGCSNNRALRTNGRDARALPPADSAQSAYQIELTRNWSFGFENYKNRRYNEVPHFFWRVVAMDSAKAFVDVYSFLANTYIQLGQPDSARLVYEIAIQTLPQNPYLYRGLAILLATRNELIAAIAQYQKIIELNAVDEDDYRRLGQLYLAAGDTANAVRVLEHLQQIVPQDLEVRNQLSSLYPARNNHEAGDQRNLELALQQSPNDTRVLFALGKAYYHSQEYDKCVVVLERYVELVPGDAYAHEYLGGAYLKLQKHHEAIAQFAIIIAQHAEHVNILTQMANCYRELKEWPVARRYAHRALAVDSHAGLVYFTIGKIYEDAARDCLVAKRNLIGFSDKLVFKLAYEQYEKALLDRKSQDQARQHMTNLEPYLPRTEDYFMNKLQDRPEGDCYTWIYK